MRIIKQSYKVLGMSCDGCKKSVESTLMGLNEVTAIVVDLESAKATLTMTAHLPLGQLEQAFEKAGLPYTIAMLH